MGWEKKRFERQRAERGEEYFRAFGKPRSAFLFNYSALTQYGSRHRINQPSICTKESWSGTTTSMWCQARGVTMRSSPHIGRNRKKALEEDHKPVHVGTNTTSDKYATIEYNLYPRARCSSSQIWLIQSFPEYQKYTWAGRREYSPRKPNRGFHF